MNHGEILKAGNLTKANLKQLQIGKRDFRKNSHQILLCLNFDAKLFTFPFFNALDPLKFKLSFVYLKK